MSLKDFRKCLAIAIKELAETRFWLRIVIRRGWLSEARLAPLLSEQDEIRKVIGSILTKTREAQATR
jgi:four helix bundle protein